MNATPHESRSKVSPMQVSPNADERSRVCFPPQAEFGRTPLIGSKRCAVLCWCNTAANGYAARVSCPCPSCSRTHRGWCAACRRLWSAEGGLALGRGTHKTSCRCGHHEVAATAPIIESLPSIRLLLAQYPFNSLHNWHFEILFIVAIIIQLIHIVLEAL
jgi:hypothetical protein